MHIRRIYSAEQAIDTEVELGNTCDVVYTQHFVGLRENETILIYHRSFFPETILDNVKIEKRVVVPIKRLNRDFSVESHNITNLLVKHGQIRKQVIDAGLIADETQRMVTVLTLMAELPETRATYKKKRKTLWQELSRANVLLAQYGTESRDEIMQTCPHMDQLIKFKAVNSDLTT
jgi:hypothetical protein